MQLDPSYRILSAPLVSLDQNQNTSIISTGYRTEALLASCVPELQFTNFILNFEHLEPEIYSDCWKIVIYKVIITEADEQGRLPNSLIAHDDYLKKKILLLYHRLSPQSIYSDSKRTYKYYIASMYYWDKAVNFVNNTAQEIGKKLSPPPQKDVFQQNGELSPNQFKLAGDHLIKICQDWQWKPSLNPTYHSKYLPQNQQYLLLEGNLCKRRLNKNLEEKKVEKKVEEKVIKQEQEDDIIVLEGGEAQLQQENEQDFRYYKMYIIYDEYYHTPRMFFSATKKDGTPVNNDAIREDIQREYLDKTLTMQKFPFIQNVIMPTVHPCRHAAVLKSMSDAMVEAGHKVESHFALLIFLKFIASVVPYVQFDTTGDLLFN